jgi:predicted alpha/beta-fold hydrolase
LFPGLSGGTNNLYTHTLAKAALAKGFNCGVLLFRCAEDIPITSCKLTCAASGEDVTEAIEFVYNKYVRDAQTKEIRTRLYAYGTSLGGILVGLHLQKHGLNAKVDGALLYCPPYDCIVGHDFFYNNFFGAYSYVLGMFLNQNLLRFALPHLRKYTTKEEGERMEMVFSTNKNGLRTLDEEIFAPMFGFKDAYDYYRGITLNGKFNQIKVPTFSLHTMDD